MEAQETSLRQAQAAVDHWIHTVGQRYYGELTNLGILTEEVGELARLLVRQYGEQSFRAGTAPADYRAALQEEMTDVLFVLLCLANQTGVDLESGFQEGLRKRTERDAERHRTNPKLQPKPEGS